VEEKEGEAEEEGKGEAEGEKEEKENGRRCGVWKPTRPEKGDESTNESLAYSELLGDMFSF